MTSDFQFKWDLLNMYLGNDYNDNENNDDKKEEQKEEDRLYSKEEVKTMFNAAQDIRACKNNSFSFIIVWFKAWSSEYFIIKRFRKD